jgi:hypothetical protein
MHGAAAACTAHGADVAAGRQHRREVVAVIEQLLHARDASDRAPFKQRLRLTSGPRQIFYLLRFSNTHTLIFELVTFMMSKFHQFFHRDS